MIVVVVEINWIWDIVVRMAGLKVQGSNPGAGNGFSFLHTRPHLPWDLPILRFHRYNVSFFGVKQTGRGAENPPLSSVEVKERFELYFYYTSVSSWQVAGRHLAFIFTYGKEQSSSDCYICVCVRARVCVCLLYTFKPVHRFSKKKKSWHKSCASWNQPNVRLFISYAQ
jgi:hypothetical protein